MLDIKFHNRSVTKFEHLGLGDIFSKQNEPETDNPIYICVGLSECNGDTFNAINLHNGFYYAFDDDESVVRYLDPVLTL